MRVAESHKGFGILGQTGPAIRGTAACPIERIPHTLGATRHNRADDIAVDAQIFTDLVDFVEVADLDRVVNIVYIVKQNTQVLTRFPLCYQ